MAFNVTGLTDYTERATEMLREAVLFTDNIKEFDAQVGIKFKEYLNYLDANPGFGNITCGLPTSGDAVLTEKEISVENYKVADKYCFADLDNKALQLIDVPASLTAELMEKIRVKVEHDLWMGDTSGTDYIDGWITLAKADAKTHDVTAVAITPTNIDDILLDMVNTVPDNLWARGVLTLYLPLNYYNMYKQNRLAANFFHESVEGMGPLEMWMFGYSGQVKIKAEASLAGSKVFIMTWPKNFVVGYDELSAVSSARWWIDEKEDYAYFKAAFKLGAQLKFGGDIVMFQGT